MSITLREFFWNHYVPHRMETVSTRNMETYQVAIRRWETLTENPPIQEITSSVLCDFKSQLTTRTFSRRKDGMAGRRLSQNTVAKLLSHVQWILDQAGPRGPRHLRSAASLLSTVPYTRPPRTRRSYKQMVPSESILALYGVCGRARLPVVEGVSPPNLWRALISTICSTALRVGQLNSTPTSALLWDQQMLVLPAQVCLKSKVEEPHPLHLSAIRDLIAIRGKRMRLFPLWAIAGDSSVSHSKTTIYAELHRLQKLAGLPRFGFHGIRRTIVTELSSVSPAAAQLAAGHASYQTTQRYQDLQILASALDHLPTVLKLST